MKPLVIRRSPWRMWGIALIGMPLGLLAIDVLTQQRMTKALQELLFPENAPQLLEPRDYFWAVVMLIVGLGLAIWGLKELILPAAVITADADGLGLKVRGPGRRPIVIPWTAIDDIGSGSVDDEGDTLPVLWIKLTDPYLIPAEPWSARWLSGDTLAVLGTDWDRTTTVAARELTDVALAATRFELNGEDE